MSNQLLDKLITRLTLNQTDSATFQGGAGSGGVTENDRLFGGLVAAQAAVAAANTAGSFPIHSLHAYFLRPGRPASNITFKVTSSKDGRNFRVRHVEAWQSDELVFQLQASFQRQEDGVSHQITMPEVPAPEACPNRDKLRGRSHWQDMPIDVRMVTDIAEGEQRAAKQQVWMRVNGEIPEQPSLHLGLMVYASDRTLLSTAWRPHAHRGGMSGASLDHSMWFHRAPRFDDWILYDMHSPTAAAGRGLAYGAMFDQTGHCLADLAQQGVMRLRPTGNV